MEFLVIGDLHLGRDDMRPQIPDSWSEYDGILLVGDVTDINASNSSLPTSIFSELSEVGPPVLSIPGNHDFRNHASVVDSVDGVTNLHKHVTTISGITIGGLGSELFDEGPEVRGTPLLNAESPQQLMNAVSTLTDKPEDPDDTPVTESLSVDDVRWYQERLDSLRHLNLSKTSTPRVLMTHIPPYGSPGAYLNSHPRFQQAVSWGSLAVRRYLEETDVSLHICGHIHEQPGLSELDSTVSLNAGYRQGFEIDITSREVPQIASVDIDWKGPSC